MPWCDEGCLESSARGPARLSRVFALPWLPDPDQRVIPALSAISALYQFGPFFLNPRSAGAVYFFLLPQKGAVPGDSHFGFALISWGFILQRYGSSLYVSHLKFFRCLCTSLSLRCYGSPPNGHPTLLWFDFYLPPQLLSPTRHRCLSCRATGFPGSQKSSFLPPGPSSCFLGSTSPDPWTFALKHQLKVTRISYSTYFISIHFS